MHIANIDTEPDRVLRGRWVIAETGRLTLTWELAGDNHPKVAQTAEADLAA